MLGDDLGKELAQQIRALAALQEARKECRKDFQTREQAIVEEINRLALAVQTGQGGLYPDERQGGG